MAGLYLGLSVLLWQMKIYPQGLQGLLHQGPVLAKEVVTSQPHHILFRHRLAVLPGIYAARMQARHML